MLLGRDHEVAAICETMGQRGAVVAIGEAGVGKTSILRAAAAAGGHERLEGGGLAMLSWESYLPVRRALGEELPLGDHAAVAAFVREAVGERVLVLDDLQWVDGDTLSLLPFLAGRVRLLTALRRGDPGCDRVLTAVRSAGLDELEVRALRGVDAAALIRARRPDLDASMVQPIVARAGGNPLLLEELSMASTSSDGLKLTLSARLQPHSDAAREMVARLGLLGRPVRREQLGEAAGELLEAGLIIASNGDVQLRHALLGEAAVEELSVASRCRLHAEIARSVSEPGEAARHHAAAGEWKPACRLALEAAELTARPGERAQHLAVAARSARPPSNELRLRAAAALIEAGDFPAALELANDVDAPGSQQRAEAELVRGRARWYLGEPARATQHVMSGLALVSGSRTPVEAQLLAQQALALAYEWRTDEAVPMARRAWEIARESGVAQLETRQVLTTALYAAASPDCLDHCRALLEEARAAGDAAREAEATSLLAAALQALGDPEGAYRLVRSAVGRSGALGLASREAELLYMQAHLEVDRGDYERAIGGLEDLLADSSGLGQHVGRAQATLATAYADTGRFTEAAELVTRALADASIGDTREFMLYTQAELEWASGRPRRALPAVDACFADHPRTHLAPLLDVVRGWALLDLGRRHEPRPRSCLYPLVAGALPEARAIWLMTGSDTASDAQALFDEAARMWHRHCMRDEVRCLWGAGQAAQLAGDLAGARLRLLEAEELAAHHGLRPLLGRIRRSLRKAGVRRSAARARTDGLLTAREREVLDLVRIGADSAEIAARLGVERSTVESVVRSFTAKLGVTTRVGAAAGGERAASTADSSPDAVALPLIIMGSLSLDHGSSGRALEARGWTLKTGWDLPERPWDVCRGRVVCTGTVSDADDAASALRAATRGAGVLVAAGSDPGVIARLYQDLSRLGPVEYRDGAAASPVDHLGHEQRAILRSIAHGTSLAETALTLHCSRRTVDRRLATARTVLGVRTTAEAVMLVREADAGVLDDGRISAAT